MATTPIYNWPTPDNTDLVKNGALAIRTLGDAVDTTMGTMVAKTIVDAKGDLIAGTAADTAARLPVGANGETLVADSSTSTGLRWQGDGSVGRNILINADFAINQRNFTSTSSNFVFMYDRTLSQITGDGTVTFSAETFTANELTVPVYGQPTNYLRCVTTGQTSSASRASFLQRLENVGTFAGQTVTFSFYAKAASGTPSVALELRQEFGSGGSSTVDYPLGKVQISDSWQRYSLTTTLNNLSGKTIGANSTFAANIFLSAGSDLATRASSLGIQTNTFDIWGWQVEVGSVATAFRTRTGTLQTELAACQRYYYSHAVGDSKMIQNGTYYATTSLFIPVQLPVTMRTSPSLVATSGVNYYRSDSAGANDNFNSLTMYLATPTVVSIYNNSEVLGVAGYSGIVFTSSSSASLAFSAEL
jgi:hypothetical protein